MQAEDIAPSQATPPSDGPFANIEPCQDLLDILTDEPDPGSRLGLGNFTQAPTEQELGNCAVQNSAFLFNVRELVIALAEPLPMLKVRVSSLWTHESLVRLLDLSLIHI